MALTDVLRQRALESSAIFVESHLRTAQLFSSGEQLHQFITDSLYSASPPGLFLEFGVFHGTTLRRWAAALPSTATDNVVYGFDSFEGLRDAWSNVNLGRGSFSTEGAKPAVEGTSLIVGWVEDTLPDFLRAHDEAPLVFAHFDMDVYPPTRIALEPVEPRLVPGSLLLFDELIGYPGWQHHEFRALNEVLDPDRYRFLGFAQEQALLQMVA